MFTIGYQGTSIEHLIDALAAAEVSVLVDTRETPMSRRAEFRPKALQAALADAGIAYRSARALGAPKALRSRATDDWDGFAEGYRERLALVREELEQLLPLIRSERVCLLCFEADPAACHRSLLTHEIQGLLDEAGVEHLRPGRTHQADDLEGVAPLREVADHEVQVARG